MQTSSVSYILRLYIPIFFANLAIPMVGIIDTALMGNLGNLSYLSATSVAANLFSMIFWSFGFLRMGTVGMVSQAHGQNNYKEILNIVLRNLLFVFAISLLIIISQYYILNLSLKIFDLLFEKHQELFNQSRIVQTLEESDLYKEKAKILFKIANQCKMVNYKQSLIKECKIIFTVDNLD